MLLAASVPFLACYGIPSLFEMQRVRAEAEATSTAQTSDVLFRAEYGSLIALCSLSPDEIMPEPVFPSLLRVLVVRNEARASVQDLLPDAWHTASPTDVSVVVCLGRQHLEPAETCLDGEIPDLTAYIGYEEGLVSAGDANAGECMSQHSDLTGRTIMRYATDVTIYDVSSGQPILQAAIWGADPPICTGADLSMLSVPEILYGPKATDSEIVDWLTASIDR
jgi:hypothetical protein